MTLLLRAVSRNWTLVVLMVFLACSQGLQAQFPSFPSCSPTILIPVITESGTAPGAVFPFVITIGVVDDCGNLITNAIVFVAFSNGDPPIRLQNLQNGQYVGTYTPTLRTSQLRIAIQASADSSTGPLRGTTVFSRLTAGLQLSQSGLILQASKGGPQPAAQAVAISAVGTSADFVATTTTRSGGNWLHVFPMQGTAAPSQTISVVADSTALEPGDYYGLIRVDSESALNAPLFVTVVLNVLPTATGTVSQIRLTSRDSNWAPTTASAPVAGCGTTLFPVITSNTGGFRPVASWPVPIEVAVMDASNHPMPSTGLVTLSFSNGDPQLSLTSNRGHWSGTWTPGTSSSSIVITARAQFRDQEGCTTLSTDVTTDAPAPIVSTGGVLSAAGFTAPYGISPGEMLSIFGQSFSTGIVSANSLPLPVKLVDTELQIAGRSMPLLFSSAGQVNAVLPMDIPPDTGYSAIAVRGAKISVPAPVLITHTNPAVFTTNGMGTQQAHAYRVTGSGSLVLADSAHPAAPGDLMVVYATGLGAVDFPVGPGAPAPLDRLVKATESIKATLGGVTAPIVFAGLAPGFSGLYQVNLSVPIDAPHGNAVPLVLSGPDQHDSPPVFVAIQ